ncbi:MAG: helix-turn-helix domain-containing protein, partial [Olleya sp.]
AEHCHLSSSYLSDLLTKETGRSAKDHINDFLIEKSKHILLSSTDSISGIAYTLGFNYPHYFGRLFKQKTGKTPQEYRQLN